MVIKLFRILLTHLHIAFLAVTGCAFAGGNPSAVPEIPGGDVSKKALSALTDSRKQSVTPAPVPSPVSPAEAKTLVMTPVKGEPLKHTDKQVSMASTIRLTLANHGTQIINLKQPAGQVLLTDPKVADVQLVTPSTLYVYGRSAGMTEIVVTGQDMVSAYRYEINVTSDYRELENLIRSFVPTSVIKVHSVPDGLLLQGTVDSAKIAEDIRSLAQRYVGAQGTVVNQLKVKSSTQINLRVKIAEVKRTVVNQLGINWSTVPLGNLRFGLFTGRQPNTLLDATTGLPTNFVPSPDTNAPGSLGFNFPSTIAKTNFSSLIDALAQESLATVLAEPNLVTRSGEEASFLVGGEYPYTVSQGTGSNLTVSIQFKPYGISLSFLPTVIGDMISIRVRPEVSDLDSTITVKDQNGNLIPAIQIRRAESTMELGNGQSMIMAGLLSEQTSGSINNFPGLGDLPILGALFRSVNYQNANTELVIVVTAYIVEPVDETQDIILPTQGLKYARLMDMILFNKINDPSGVAPSPRLVGNAGFFY